MNKSEMKVEHEKAGTGIIKVRGCNTDCPVW